MSHVWIPPNYDPDILGKNLAYSAWLARQMPPAWDGARISQPLALPDGNVIGLMLPGKGLKLHADLKDLGIVKPIPGVYEDSLTRRLLDLLEDERGAITTYNGIIAARCGGNGNDVSLFKPSTTTVTTVWHSLSSVAGGIPDAMTYTNIPGGAVQTRSNNGAWSLGMSNPGGSNKKYLLTLGWAAAQQINMLMLVDLLVAAGNISCNSGSSPYTINTTALTRYTGGGGVMMTFEVTTQLSATATNINVSAYHNQAGTASRATGAILLTTSAIVGRLLPIALGPCIQLQAGDYGVQSVETITMSGANTGVLCLNLYYPLAFCPGVGAGVYTERDSTVQIDGITELLAPSSTLGCLTVYVLPNTTSTGIFNMFLRTCEG